MICDCNTACDLNILLFRYQIILILKIIAKLELPEEGNDVLNAKRFGTKSALL